jgi:hypothetical protein
MNKGASNFQGGIMAETYKTLPKRLEGFAERWVPLLRTYLKREGIRDSDKLIRDELARRLDELKKELDLMKRDWTDAGHLAGLDLLDRATRHIEKVRDSIRFASRGYSGIFDPGEVAEDELLALLDFDQKLFEQVDTLSEDVNKLKGTAKAGIKAELRKFEDRLKEFDKVLGDRNTRSRSRK